VAGSGGVNAAGAVWMAVNGPSPKVPKAVIEGEDVAGSGVLFWSGKKSGLKNVWLTPGSHEAGNPGSLPLSEWHSRGHRFVPVRSS